MNANIGRLLAAYVPHFTSGFLFVLASILAPQAFAVIYNLPPDASPMSIGDGDVLNLSDGGELYHSFVAEAGSTLNIYGGAVQSNGGLNGFYGTAGSEINMYGGDLGTEEYAIEGVFNLYDGKPGDFAFFDGLINLYGGDAGKNGGISGTVNLHGGNFQDNFYGLDVGVLNIFGRSFFLDGEELVLTPGVPTVIPERDVVLSGQLDDNLPFSFSLDLMEGGVLTPGFVAEGFTVTATLTVPEPASGALLLLATLFSIALCRRRQ